MKFQVNQKVIALNNPLSPRSQHRSKGNIYTVTALSWCAGCGINFINIEYAIILISKKIKCIF